MKNILIFKKLVEKYFKKYIKKYNKYFEYYKICRKPKPKPYLTWRCSVFDCLLIIIY